MFSITRENLTTPIVSGFNLLLKTVGKQEKRREESAIYYTDLRNTSEGNVKGVEARCGAIMELPL